MKVYCCLYFTNEENKALRIVRVHILFIWPSTSDWDYNYWFIHVLSQLKLEHLFNFHQFQPSGMHTVGAQLLKYVSNEDTLTIFKWKKYK